MRSNWIEHLTHEAAQAAIFIGLKFNPIYNAQAVMQIPMQLDVKQKIAADYNMDGQISADDANAILLRYLDIFMQE